MATNVIKIPANIVSKGDILVYARKKYTIAHTLHLGSKVQLQYDGGYFNFNEGRIVEIVDKRVETPTIEFNTQITPIFLPYGGAVKPFSDEEDVKGADVEVGDVIWHRGNWKTVTNVYKHPNSPFNKVNFDCDGVKGLQVRLSLFETYSRKVRAVMETLNIQNAIEAQRILLQKLEQMLDLQQLAPTEDGKIAIGNCNIRVDKATVVKAARDEMKAAASKSAELIKKL